MKNLLSGWALALGVIFAILGLMPANAADTVAPISIVIPWGDWLSGLLVSLAATVVSLVGLAVRRWLPSYLSGLVTDAAISNAVNFALGKVEGAVAGKTLEPQVANAVIAAAAQYAIKSEPRVAKWLGDNLQAVILAKLSALGSAPAAAVALPK